MDVARAGLGPPGLRRPLPHPQAANNRSRGLGPPQRAHSTEVELAAATTAGAGGDGGDGEDLVDRALEDLTAASLLLSRLFGVDRPERIDPEDVGGEADGGADQATTAPTGRAPGRQVVSSEEASVRASLSYSSFQMRVEHTDASGTTTVEVSAFHLSAEVEVVKQDPLVLDLDGDGVETTGVEHGALFDLDGDGRTDRMSSVTGGDAFLAWDRNGDGHIGDGRELFGDQHGAADGIAELRRHDDDADGRLTATDRVWDELRLFDPATGDRVLADAGITAIDLSRLTYAGVSGGGGDELVDALDVHRVDGTRVRAYDALLSVARG